MNFEYKSWIDVLYFLVVIYVCLCSSMHASHFSYSKIEDAKEIEDPKEERDS